MTSQSKPTRILKAQTITVNKARTISANKARALLPYESEGLINNVSTFWLDTQDKNIMRSFS